MNLSILGWNSFFEKHFEPYRLLGYSPARIASEHKNLYHIVSEQGTSIGQISGKMRYESISREDFPAVGDWVAVSFGEDGNSIIHAILPRQTKFSRNVAGKTTQEQIIAANINYVFIVTSLNSDFNIRRIERYLTLVWESGANPIIILSKADLCEDLNSKINEVAEIAFGVPIHAISTVNNTGLAELSQYFKSGNTIAFLGSSGVGKSTLINQLSPESLQRVQDIRLDDDKGRHTTTHRQLIVLPQKGVVIDSPGMRELQLWASEESLTTTFEDVEYFARQCFFKDCQHQSEENCAVKAALETGTLNPERYENYLKLKKELAYHTRKQNQSAALAEKEKWKGIHKLLKSIKKR